MEDEDFLDAIWTDDADATEQAIPEAAEPVEAPEPEPIVEPEPEPAVNPLTPPVVEHKPDPGFVPISVVLDEREKRQKLEAEMAQFRAQQQKQPVPDMFDDPEGYQAIQDQKLYQQNLRWSERIASIQHGADTVKQAMEWGVNRCATDPFFNAKVASSDDPVGFAVAEWQREQIATQVTPTDFAEFQAWKQAQARINAPAPQTAATPTPSRSVPPRSLASAPSAGGVMTEVIQTDEEVFDEVFSRK